MYLISLRVETVTQIRKTGLSTSYRLRHVPRIKGRQAIGKDLGVELLQEIGSDLVKQGLLPLLYRSLLIMSLALSKSAC